MYINKEDYRAVISDKALDVIDQSDEYNRSYAEQEAVEEVSGYLRPTYDCDLIFAKTGEGRNRQLIMILCDIALYHLIASAPQRMGSEIRKERYDRAIKWLEGVQRGKIIPDLPRATDEEGNDKGAILVFGSQEKQNNTW